MSNEPKNVISPEVWQLLNNLTATIHKHAESHRPEDFIEKARAESALASYIARAETAKVQYAALQAQNVEVVGFVERLIETAEKMVWWVRCCSQENVRQSLDSWNALTSEWRSR